MAHLFICPHCGTRTTATDRTAGFRREAKGCSNCGFPFLFELLDDYYPAPDAAFFVCDQAGRVIGAGRGSFELTGLKEEKIIGRPVNDVLGKPVSVIAEGDLPARATADLFPAYDDDVFLLDAPTTEK